MNHLLRFSRAGALFAGALLSIACGQSPTGAGGSTAASSTTSTGAGASQPVAIMDWNTHNFFNDKLDGTPPEIDPVPTTAEYQARLQVIGGVIHMMNPDIVMLQEVEHQSVLDDMNAAALGGVYGTLLIEGNDPRGIDVGMLTKIQPDKIVSHKDDTFTMLGTAGPSYKYARDCLEVHFLINGQKVVLLGVHFRSKSAPDDPDKRLAEAQHTRAIADTLSAADPSLFVVVLGDFNDVPGSPPVDVFSSDGAYIDAADSVAAAERYSFNFNGALQLIDHQFGNKVAHGMLDPSSVVLKHGPNIDDVDTNPSSIASDHSPLYAVYNIK